MLSQLEDSTLIKLAKQWQIYDNVDDRIRVVFTGSFNAGKSTLINKLIQKELLPTGQTPETSVVTSIEFAPFERFQMVRENEIINIPTKHSLKQAISGNSSIDNLIKIQTPSMLSENTVFIDLPGTNAPSLEHSIITQQYLPLADIVLYLMPIKRGLQRTDLNELQKIERLVHPKNIIIVFTQAYSVSENDRSTVDKFVRKQLPQSLKTLDFCFIDSEPRVGGPKGLSQLVGLLEEKTTNFSHSNRIQQQEQKIQYLLERQHFIWDVERKEFEQQQVLKAEELKKKQQELERTKQRFERELVLQIKELTVLGQNELIKLKNRLTQSTSALRRKGVNIDATNQEKVDCFLCEVGDECTKYILEFHTNIQQVIQTKVSQTIETLEYSFSEVSFGFEIQKGWEIDIIQLLDSLPSKEEFQQMGFADKVFEGISDKLKVVDKIHPLIKILKGLLQFKNNVTVGRQWTFVLSSLLEEYQNIPIQQLNQWWALCVAQVKNDMDDRFRQVFSIKTRGIDALLMDHKIGLQQLEQRIEWLKDAQTQIVKGHIEQ